MTSGKCRTFFVALLALLLTASYTFTPSAQTARARDAKEATPKQQAMQQAKHLRSALSDDGESIHADPKTFQKNYELTQEQKRETIQAIEKAVSDPKLISDEMSDLEKYFNLAVWTHKQVEYDWQFWSGSYNFDYYRHQWDAYGGITEGEKSVCVGIAIFYSNMCHAADLPCRFVRIDPDTLDHTIDYIPDINGKAYYLDVTEDFFLMSEKANPFEPIDKEFSHITDPDRYCTDNTFNPKDGESYEISGIKKYYDTPFEEWFKEYGLHQDTDKNFDTEYVEKGSGAAGYHRASYSGVDRKAYKDDPENLYNEPISNWVDHPDIWFLDDFYKNPAELKAKILAKQFDDQLVEISGFKKNYDCEIDDLEAAVKQDLKVSYFPSCEDGKVVAKTAELQDGSDYDLIFDGYDEQTKTATFTVEGTGAYSGTKTFSVKVNSAVVVNDPVRKIGLEYNGEEQELIEPGEALGGEMQYALGTKDEPTEEFSAAVPTRENAGTYYVWYKVVGADGRTSTEPQRLEKPVSIAPLPISIMTEDKKIKVGESYQISPSLDPEIPVPVVFTFENNDPNDDTISVTEDGLVTGLNEGSASVFVDAKLKVPNKNYEVPYGVWVEFTVVEDTPVDIGETKVKLSRSTFTYNGKVQKPQIQTIKGLKLKEGTDYEATWSDASSKKAGTYTITIEGKGLYTGTTDVTYTIKKAKNPLTLKAKTVSLKSRKLKKKAQTVKQTRAFKVSKAKGTLSYRLVSAQKGNRLCKNKFAVNKKTGKITAKKGLKKGTYKVRVKVKAKGTANYKASAWKAVTFKVIVK